MHKSEKTDGDTTRKKKTIKVDKNDNTWSLSKLHDTIDKSHKFLVLQRLHAVKPESSVYEPKKQVCMRLNVRECVIEMKRGRETVCALVCLCVCV